MKAKITKLWERGVSLPDKKLKPVECWFSFEPNRGRNYIGGVSEAPSGTNEAMALTEGGGHVLPQLHHAQITGVYANGLRVRGCCWEDSGLRRQAFFYCEWWVSWIAP